MHLRDIFRKLDLGKRDVFFVLLSIFVTTIAFAFWAYQINHTAKTKAAAVNCYWVGDTSPADWNDASHWDASAGGDCDGGVVPGSDDTVYFTSDNTNSANINAAANVAGFNINSGYTGTITQNAGITVAIGTSDFTQADGTFTGGDSNITLSDAYTLSGGVFNSTSATLSITGDFTHTAVTGTFNEDAGMVTFTGNSKTYDVNSTETFNNVTLNKNDSSNLTISANDTMVVAGTLTLTNGSFAGSTGKHRRFLLGKRKELKERN